MVTDEITARRDELLGLKTPLFYDSPVHLVRGEGAWLYDADGRRYVDLYNNIPVVGHCNQRVVEALARQAATLNTHSRYLDDVILDYAERLLGLHADGIERVVFTCTGTEANEVAMQMARIATGGRGFVCTDAAYHGHSDLVGSLTYAPARGRPDVHSIPFPDAYRPIEEGLTSGALCDRYLAELRAAIDDFATEGVQFAGVLFCSILANEGLPDIPPGFMARAAAMVREAGGLVIFDEVQAGFCRTGRWWGYEGTDVVPDIVTMGKPIGNGFPLGACAARADLVDSFRERTHYFNTFAASPVHGAVGLAVLAELEERRLADNAATLGAYLKDQIDVIAAPIEGIGAIRARGLFLGIECVEDRVSKRPDRGAAAGICNGLRKRGFLTGTSGAYENQIKIRPPLVFDQVQADFFLEALADVLRGG